MFEIVSGLIIFLRREKIIRVLINCLPCIYCRITRVSLKPCRRSWASSNMDESVAVDFRSLKKKKGQVALSLLRYFLMAFTEHNPSIVEYILLLV